MLLCDVIEKFCKVFFFFFLFFNDNLISNFKTVIKKYENKIYVFQVW